MKRIIVTCLLTATLAGCAAKDARTLTTIFEGLEAISALDQAHQQTRIADALEKGQQAPEEKK